MALDAKSCHAATGLNDIFAKLPLRGFSAWATDDPDAVLVQYHSERHGCTRTVSCVPGALVSWLNTWAFLQGWLSKLLNILDRKEQWQAAPHQAELNLGNAPGIASRSLRAYRD